MRARRLAPALLALASAAVLALSACTPTTPSSSSGTSTRGDDAAAEDTASTVCPALEEGDRISGADLSACVVAATEKAGSGAATATVDALGSRIAASLTFTTTDPTSVHLVGDASIGEIILIGDRGWLRDPAGWIEADPNGDLRAISASGAVSTLKTVADPSANAEYIAQFDEWTVTGPETVGGASGMRVEPVENRRDLDTVVISDLAFVLDADYRPLSSAGRSQTPDGVQADTLFVYRDWGVPVTIAPPV
ncbi:hypothetical protein [Schumannella sp. 10F1B-5-1]|uniref:hypothetical protein n=1 Tax=Schumannella sp. 10F1B-5-1 TaxID=2590780 RepID=UPI001131CFB1|nr:hypothetical protein [Schumannella sp. 10F1B-5-1]TPW71009.1 hypothetical protein FJ658_13005 [Schumannella sp. 10F1B-5-1]